jgi:hypothetical protein
VLVGPQYHRLHHRIGLGHESAGAGTLGGHNFAVLFPLWDLLFGTARFDGRYDPPASATSCPPTAAATTAEGFWAQQWLGLKRLAARCWRRFAAQARHAPIGSCRHDEGDDRRHLACGVAYCLHPLSRCCGRCCRWAWWPGAVFGLGWFWWEPAVAGVRTCWGRVTCWPPVRLAGRRSACPTCGRCWRR